MSVKKKIPLFERMADEISEAVVAVVEKYSPEIKLRRRSPHLVNYWITEGAKKGADKTIYKKSIARWKKKNGINENPSGS